MSVEPTGGAPPAEEPDTTVDPATLRFAWDRLPYVTPELPGVGGVLRATPEDFRVEEIPAYEPEGHGSHLYLKVEKRGLTTRDLVLALLGPDLAESQIGVAGLKDKHAVTTQWLSLPKAHEGAADALLELPGVRVLERSYHRNKLGIGHLRGNRFEVVVRGVDAEPAGEAARAVLEALGRLGSPNYFGPQRFGRFGTNAVDGLALVHGERVPGGQRLRRFFLSALQSLVFNDLLAERVRAGLYRCVVDGDWARRHDSGGVFKVMDPEAESVRAERLEISPLLPLHGRKVRVSEGLAGEMERTALARYGLRWSSFAQRRGDRRPSRIVLSEASAEPLGEDGLRIRFVLPKGSYATVVLREIMKVEVDAPLEPGAAPAEASAQSDDEDTEDGG